MANLPMPPVTYNAAVKPDEIMVLASNIVQPSHLSNTSVPMPPQDSQLQEAAVGYPS